MKEQPTSVEEGSGGLSIKLQFEQETTSRTTIFPSVSDIFTEPSFDIGSDDFSTPPESPRTFDTSKFFNTNLPSKGSSKSKEGLEKTQKNSFHTSNNEDKKNVLKDIFNILEDKDVVSTSRPKVVVNEKRLPFTVVRVSSSVSQIRPNNNENNIRVSEGKLSNVEKEEEIEKEQTPSRSSLFFPTRPIPTTTKEIKESPTKPRIVPDKKKQDRKKSGGSSGSRQPFLKPIAKFPDIRIPSLDKKNNNNNVKRPRPFNFNRGSGGRPLSPVLGFRTTTAETTTTTTTAFESESFESSTTTTSTTKPKTFANIFNRFSFATPDKEEETTTTESIESIKSLLDLIPKDVQEAKETTSSRSLLELIPGLIINDEENLFDFEDGQIDNEINEATEEVNTLRASLDIIPIKSTTDRNTLNGIEEVTTKVSSEEDTRPETGEVPEKTRDLQIIPIPPRPPRPTPTEEVSKETTEETTPKSTTTPQKTTARKISRLQEIVQRRRTTTSSPPVTVKNPTKPLSRKKLFETIRGGNRPTISIRFRNRPNVTQVSETQPIDVDTSSKVEGIQPTDQSLSPETTKEDTDNTEPTESNEEETTTELSEADKTNNGVRPTIGGGRSRSRFRPKSKLSDLFPKRRPSGNTGNIGNKRRPFFRPRNRLTTLPPSSTIEDDNEDTETTINTTPKSQTPASTARRRPTFRRLPTRPPVPQNTRSPLLKSILDRARQRGVGRRTTRAPLTIVNKVNKFKFSTTFIEIIFLD